MTDEEQRDLANALLQRALDLAGDPSEIAVAIVVGNRESGSVMVATAVACEEELKELLAFTFQSIENPETITEFRKVAKH